jgi:hypothetical protein
MGGDMGYMGHSYYCCNYRVRSSVKKNRGNSPYDPYVPAARESQSAYINPTIDHPENHIKQLNYLDFLELKLLKT